jgi:hypothetical protein
MIGWGHHFTTSHQPISENKKLTGEGLWVWSLLTSGARRAQRTDKAPQAPC